MENLPKPTLVEEEVNPYAPPKAEVVAVEATLDLSEAYETASKTKRFINYVVDRVVVVGVLFVLGTILAVLEELGHISGAMDWLDEMNRLEDFAVTGVVTVGYYWVMESVWGRTLGKLVTGTLVIDDAGLRVGARAVFWRSLIRLIPFEPFSMLGSSAWHDGWSKTQVIDLRKKQTVRLSPVLRRYYR